MRRLAPLLLVGFICLAGGFYAGWAACSRAHSTSAGAALQRASEALTVGRVDEALEYAFAALDRDPEQFSAYELAGDAITAQPPRTLAGHYYRAALGGVGKGRGATAGGAKELAAQRARIQAKIAALNLDP
jgi:Tfp pilus assembly protein PilF